MRYARRVLTVLRSLPVLLRFVTTRSVGAEYGVGFSQKLVLFFRILRNTRRIETLSNYREHLALASAILSTPAAVGGCVVECGSYVGGSTANLSLVCALANRRLLVFDSFAGLPEPAEYDRFHPAVHVHHVDVYFAGRFAASQETVERNVREFGNISVCEFRAGFYADTMKDFEEPLVLAFLDVDLIDSLRSCLTGLWPNLVTGGWIYVHEARNLDLVRVFFDHDWWQKTLRDDSPGFVGSGVGLPLGMGVEWGSELGYAQKVDKTRQAATFADPATLEAALTQSEKQRRSTTSDA
jgi:hypothetical protein